MDYLVLSRWIILAGGLKYYFRKRKLKTWQTVLGVAVVLGLTVLDGMDYFPEMGKEYNQIRDMALTRSPLTYFDGADRFFETAEGAALRDGATTTATLEGLFAWRKRTGYDQEDEDARRRARADERR